MRRLLLIFLFCQISYSVKSQLIDPKVTFNGIDSIQIGLPRFVFKEEYKKAFTGNGDVNIYHRWKFDSVGIIQLGGIDFKLQQLFFYGNTDSTLYGIAFLNLYGHKLGASKFVDIQSDVERFKAFITKQIGMKPKIKKLNSYKGSINERFIWKQKKANIIIQFSYNIPDFSNVSLSFYIGELNN